MYPKPGLPRSTGLQILISLDTSDQAQSYFTTVKLITKTMRTTCWWTPRTASERPSSSQRGGMVAVRARNLESAKSSYLRNSETSKRITSIRIIRSIATSLWMGLLPTIHSRDWICQAAVSKTLVLRHVQKLFYSVISKVWSYKSILVLEIWWFCSPNKIYLVRFLTYFSINMIVLRYTKFTLYKTWGDSPMKLQSVISLPLVF